MFLCDGFAVLRRESNNPIVLYMPQLKQAIEEGLSPWPVNWYDGIKNASSFFPLVYEKGGEGR